MRTQEYKQDNCKTIIRASRDHHLRPQMSGGRWCQTNARRSFVITSHMYITFVTCHIEEQSNTFVIMKYFNFVLFIFQCRLVRKCRLVRNTTNEKCWTLTLFLFFVFCLCQMDICQNLGAASSNRVRTRQDTMDVDCVLGNNREERK